VEDNDTLLIIILKS